MGQELTKPLRVLNDNCEFRKKYLEQEEFCNPIRRCSGCGKELKEGGVCSEECKEIIRKTQKKYNDRPEIKARKMEYGKKYYKKPEVIARMKEYNKRPEVILRRNKYARDRYARKKMEKLNAKQEL